MPCATLAAWDRKADLDSRGAVLFREFWNRAGTLPDLWATPFNPADPVNTPSGVAVAAEPALLDALRAASAAMQEAGVPVYGQLGDYQFETRNNRHYPLHGGIGNEDGSYSSLHMRSALTAKGYGNVDWGTSYIQLVGFDNAGAVARGLLVYGQSVDPKSPWYADQLTPFAQKKLLPLPFSEQQIKAERISSQVLTAK